MMNVFFETTVFQKIGRRFRCPTVRRFFSFREGPSACASHRDALSPAAPSSQRRPRTHCAPAQVGTLSRARVVRRAAASTARRVDPPGSLFPPRRRESSRRPSPLSRDGSVRGRPDGERVPHSEDPRWSARSGHRDGVTACAFNPNMKQLVSSSGDHSLHDLELRSACAPTASRGTKTRCCLYVLATGRVYRQRLQGPNRAAVDAQHRRSVHAQSAESARRGGAFRALLARRQKPRGRPQDKTLKIWSTPDGKFLSTLSGHTNWVNCGDFSPNGRCVVSASDDKTVRLWDVDRSPTCSTLTTFSPVSVAKFHPDGLAIATAGDDDALQWDVRSKKLVQHYQAAHGGAITSVSFHPSGNFLLTASADNTVKVWDLREGQLFYTLNGHEGAATCCEFSPGGDYFATGGADANVMVWKTNFDRALGDGYSPGPAAKAKAKRSAPRDGSAEQTSPPETASPAPPVPPPPPPAAARPRHPRRRRTTRAAHPRHRRRRRRSPRCPRRRPCRARRPRALSLRRQGAPDSATPEALASTLSHIVGQLDVLTPTMGLLEERLTMNEDKTNKVVQIIGAAAEAEAA